VPGGRHITPEAALVAQEHLKRSGGAEFEVEYRVISGDVLPMEPGSVDRMPPPAPPPTCSIVMSCSASGVLLSIILHAGRACGNAACGLPCG
jgi:hypothetical protein